MADNQKKTNAPKLNMVRKLVPLIKDKKVMVFIDGSNLYYVMHQTGLRFDFEYFQNWLKKRTNLIDVHYYSAFDPEDSKQVDFLNDLDKMGYVIHKKPIKWVIDHHKGNMDVELAVDSMYLQPNYDLMLLISGDGDFSYLCQALEKISKKTIVFSMGGYTAQELHDSADNYFFLERVKSAWQRPHREKTKKTASTKTSDIVLTPLVSEVSIPKIYI